MGLRLASPDETYRGTVRVHVPGADAAAAVPVRWRVLTAGEIDDLLTQGGAALALRALADWSDVSDADGAPIPFAPEAVERLCELPYVRRAIEDDYLRWVAGHPEKNS